MLQKIISRSLIISIIFTGCGVALTPLFSHANTCPAPVSGTGDPLTASCDVSVSASVDSSVAMQIINSDGGSGTTEDPYVISTTGINGTSNIDNPKTFTTRVSTNNPAGYALSIIDEDTDNSLAHTTIDGQKIPACTTLDGSTSCWAVKSQYLGSHTGVTALSNYTAVPASNSTALTLVNYTSSVAGGITNDDTKVSIGISISGSQVAGTYQDRVLMTATAPK